MCGEFYRFMVTETTIGLSRDTRNRLDRKKVHKRQSYEEVIKKLLDNEEALNT